MEGGERLALICPARHGVAAQEGDGHAVSVAVRKYIVARRGQVVAVSVPDVLQVQCVDERKDGLLGEHEALIDEPVRLLGDEVPDRLIGCPVVARKVRRIGIAVIVGGERIEAAVIDLRPFVYIDGVGKVQLGALLARVVLAVCRQGAVEGGKARRELLLRYAERG